MLVKIGNKIYNSEIEPISVIFQNFELETLKKASKNSDKFKEFRFSRQEFDFKEITEE